MDAIESSHRERSIAYSRYKNGPLAPLLDPDRALARGRHRASLPDQPAEPGPSKMSENLPSAYQNSLGSRPPRPLPRQRGQSAQIEPWWDQRNLSRGPIDLEMDAIESSHRERSIAYSRYKIGPLAPLLDPERALAKGRHRASLPDQPAEPGKSMDFEENPRISDLEPSPRPPASRCQRARRGLLPTRET